MNYLQIKSFVQVLSVRRTNHLSHLGIRRQENPLGGIDHTLEENLACLVKRPLVRSICRSVEGRRPLDVPFMSGTHLCPTKVSIRNPLKTSDIALHEYPKNVDQDHPYS